jgi:phosphatidylglycerophosphate synthase
MFTVQKNILNFFQDKQIVIAHFLVKFFIKTSITPNQITVVRAIIFTPIFAYLFSRGEYYFNLIALLFVFIALTLDFVDGELARQKNMTSLLGKFLDEILDLLYVCVILFSIYLGYVNTNNKFTDIFAVSLIFFLLNNFYQVHLLRNFDENVGYEISGKKPYSDIIEDFKNKGFKVKISDYFFLSFIDVHANSLSKILFTISYALLVGIIFKVEYICFMFLGITFFIRNIFLLYILFIIKIKKKCRIEILNFLIEK